MVKLFPPSFYSQRQLRILPDRLGPRELSQRDTGDRAMMTVIRHLEFTRVAARHKMIDQSMFRIEKIFGTEGSQECLKRCVQLSVKATVLTE